MKRSFWLMTLLSMAILIFAGCQSNQTRAQKLYDAGKYDEVITRYASDPAAAGVVQNARNKIAEGLLQAGRYQTVLDSYPQTPAAKDAMERVADQLLQERRFQEILDKYPTSGAAATARSELNRMRNDSIAGRTPKSGVSPKPGTTPKESTGDAAARNKVAQAELDRIMNIKIPDLRTKALREFIANPAYAGTDAAGRAQTELNRAAR